MQQANQKMIEMKGYNDQTFQAPFMIKENKDGEMEATVLGNNIASIPKDEDHKEIAQPQRNLFSQLAQWLSTMLTTLIENILEAVGAFF